MLIVNLDVMLARRKMSVTELAQRVGITLANISILEKRQGKGHSFFHAGENLSGAGMPARGYFGVPGRLTGAASIDKRPDKGCNAGEDFHSRKCACVFS